jgi:hypothetical protein
MSIQAAPVDENLVGLVSVVVIFVVFPIVLAFARMIWKRGSAPPATRGAVDSTDRLIQMQQSIDAMAVEVERISENQRYLTRLLAERPAEALPSQDPERVSSRSGRGAG